MTSDFNEKELLEMLAEDSEYAFASIFDHYRPRVQGTAVKLLKSTSLAEEVVQDVFLKLWLKRREMNTVSHLSAFILTMTRNLVFDRFKKKVHEAAYRKHIEQLPAVINDTDHKVRTSLAGKVLQHAIDGLPARQKQVYEMVRIQGLSMEEISENLSISKSTAKGHLTAALQSIRNYLEKHPDTLLDVVGIQVLISIFHQS
ncbi:RNA polymerase sigma factor [Chitinophaga sp.]|uniref:RNA polymerase sigma factor n=1 Tax=Chitinophaga sp. TaxID=1869181 RepID=UPI002BB26BD3|nr:sigma-70 family RNA polymerase sigma factor [Chitinophaga sp.]HWV66662.1 sigma-70 family RNA polymerase sigma factor [Chitinophaga sp.]